MPELASDVLAFMDAMELGRATVVGQSMGSLVAQELALAAPDRMTCMVLIGSATNIRSDEIRELQRLVNELADPVPKEFAREFQVSTIHHPVPEEFLDRAVDESLKLPARVWRTALEGQLAVENTDRVPRIETPTFLLRGDHDQLFPGRHRMLWLTAYQMQPSSCIRKPGTRFTGNGQMNSFVTLKPTVRQTFSLSLTSLSISTRIQTR